MTNAAALAVLLLDPRTQFDLRVRFRRLTHDDPALGGPCRAAALVLYYAYYETRSVDDERPMRAQKSARFCENHLRAVGRSEDADLLAAVGRLMAFGLDAETSDHLHHAENLRILFDRDGVPSILVRSRRPMYGLPIPPSRHHPGPDLDFALVTVQLAQQRFLPDSLVCPLCFRPDAEHDASCPAHVPIDPTRVNTLPVRAIGSALPVPADTPGPVEPGEPPLKPCPFCASIAPVVHLGDDPNTHRVFVQCGDCGMTGPPCPDQELAQVRWNHRTPRCA